MRKSKTLAKLRAGKMVRMCSMGNFTPAYIRHAAHYGFDAIWLDNEHRCMGDREVQALLAFFHHFDIDCMLRPSTTQRTRLYRYLEDGAAGLMIPHVSTVEKARDLVAAVKFPPIGDRGLDGASFDSDFILAGGPNYPQEANEETFLVVQIETPLALENVDAIAAVEGVDGLFIGPGDLSLRLNLMDPPMPLQKAVDQVAEAASKHGKAWGLPVPDKQQMQHYRSQGAQILAHGGEFWALMKMLEASAATYDEVEQE